MVRPELLIYYCDTEWPPLATSSAEDWKSTGQSLFRHKQYHQAMHCFEKAELPTNRAVAEAYYLRQCAKRSKTGDASSVKHVQALKAAYLRAADAFTNCASLLESNAGTYHRRAAECFIEAGDHGRAGESYRNAELFTNAVKQFKVAKMYDEAVAIVLTKKDDVDENIAENIIDVSRLHYLKAKRLEYVNSFWPDIR